jgi:hypothetical protein
MSGKAMHGTVPPARTAFREVTQVKESEGHYLVCGLFVDSETLHFPRQNS